MMLNEVSNWNEVDVVNYYLDPNPNLYAPQDQGDDNSLRDQNPDRQTQMQIIYSQGKEEDHNELEQKFNKLKPKGGKRKKKNSYSCMQPGCDLTFRYRFSLKRHWNLKHGPKKFFVCFFQGCYKTYCEKWRLTRHQRNSH